MRSSRSRRLSRATSCACPATRRTTSSRPSSWCARRSPMSRSSTKISATRYELREAVTATDVAACRELFVEYQRALGVSLCFQDFDEELARLPGDYAPPRGRLVLAFAAGKPAG